MEKYRVAKKGALPRGLVETPSRVGQFFRGALREPKLAAQLAASGAARAEREVIAAARYAAVASVRDARDALRAARRCLHTTTAMARDEP